ncbi:MAG: M48 family metallopeptidase [Phycisphaerales bacterium]
MHLLIIALFFGLYLHDGAPGLVSSGHGWATLISVMVLPKLCLIGVYALACRWAFRGLSRDGAGGRLRKLEMVGAAFRIGGIVLFYLDLHLGLLVLVRGGIGSLTGIAHPVLIDELLVILPTLLYWGAGWCVYYPIDRRLREATLIRQLDQGLPIEAVWSRSQYVLSQYRYQVALILLPLLAVIAWQETVELMVLRGVVSGESEPWWTIAGCAAIFLIAPLIIRVAWDTIPLPEGEIRAHLLGMCKAYRVRINELLLWRTYGGMINAAVMGFVGPLRFILVTDGLLQQLPGPHVEAVMAHELAHVRKRHMAWLLVSAVSLMGVVEALGVVFLAMNGVGISEIEGAFSVTGPDTGIVPAGFGFPALTETDALLLLTLACAAAAWALGFGWVSRRIERQADSFAVEHLARERGGDTIAWSDALTMIDALQRVADLNHVRAEKHSWRHGSIRWRQDYLRSLVGQPVGKLGIDRLMRWVNALSLGALLAAAALHAWLG